MGNDVLDAMVAASYWSVWERLMSLQEWFVLALRPARFIPGRYSTFQAVAPVIEAEENIFVRLQALVDTHPMQMPSAKPSKTRWQDSRSQEG
jgi:hypothetical protein